MRRTTVVAVLATGVLALVAAGCGGSDESSASDETTIEETLTQETTDSTDSTETTVTDTDDETETSALPNLDDLSEECKELVSLSSEFSAAFGAVGSGSEGLADASEAFEAFADRVPEEIRDDFRVLAEAFTTYADALKDVDLSSGETPDAETLAKLQGIIQSLDQEEVQAASDRITAWSTENCAP